MKKSDIPCLLDEVFGAQVGVRESRPVRYLVASKGDDCYEVFETGDLTYYDPQVHSLGSYPVNEDSPKEFLDWFVNS